MSELLTCPTKYPRTVIASISYIIVYFNLSSISLSSLFLSIFFFLFPLLFTSFSISFLCCPKSRTKFLILFALAHYFHFCFFRYQLFLSIFWGFIFPERNEAFKRNKLIHNFHILFAQVYFPLPLYFIASPVFHYFSPFSLFNLSLS